MAEVISTDQRPQVDVWGLLNVVRSNPVLAAGTVMVCLFLVVAIFGPQLAPYPPNAVSIGPSLSPPSSEFLMGTDPLGRDILSRIIVGSRTSLLIALPAVSMAAILGGILGIIAGYAGQRVDQVIMRSMDMFLAFPDLLLALAVVAVLGPSTRNLILTIGIVYAPRMARIARAPVISLREQEFVIAARVAGASPLHIMIRHIVPNITSPVVVEATIAAALAILLESALSYLGLGAPPPTASWGQMLSSARHFMTSAPSSAVFPGLAIAYAATSFLLLGNGLRDWLDPRRRPAPKRRRP